MEGIIRQRIQELECENYELQKQLETHCDTMTEQLKLVTAIGQNNCAIENLYIIIDRANRTSNDCED